MAWALGIFITATHVFNLVVFFTACIPLAQYWSYAPGGFCIQTKVPYIVGSVLFAVSDAVVLLFPMPLIWRMRTSWRRRLQITGIFLLGSFVVAIGIVKAVLIVCLLLLFLLDPCVVNPLRTRPFHVTFLLS